MVTVCLTVTNLQCIIILVFMNVHQKSRLPAHIHTYIKSYRQTDKRQTDRRRHIAKVNVLKIDEWKEHLLRVWHDIGECRGFL